MSAVIEGSSSTGGTIAEGALVDQLKTELEELRSYNRRMQGAWEVFSSIADGLIGHAEVGLQEIDGCEKCKRVMFFFHAARDVMMPYTTTAPLEQLLPDDFN